MGKKKIIAIVLAVLIAGGLGGFAYANNIQHEPMTGQKLVGYGFYGTLPLEDDNADIHTMFVFTNPDCVNEITIDRVFILAFNGEVLHEVALPGDEGIIEPHEVSAVELHDYIDPQEPIMPVTVEIFWTGDDNKGLPLIGWTQTGYMLFDEGGNLLEVTVGENQMVNMEQELKSKD